MLRNGQWRSLYSYTVLFFSVLHEVCIYVWGGGMGMGMGRGRGAMYWHLSQGLYLNSFRCSFSLTSFCNSTSFDILNQPIVNIFRFKSNILNLKESWSKNKGYYNVCIYQTFISCIQRVSMGITKRLQVQGYHRNVPFLLYVNFVMHSLYFLS